MCHLLTCMLHILCRMARAHFVVFSGKLECGIRKSAEVWSLSPVRGGLIFSDLGITCFLLHFFLLFDNFLTNSTRLWLCSVAGNYPGIAFSWCFWQLSLAYKSTGAACQGLECSAPATVRFKQWLSVFDTYGVLMGEECAGEVHHRVSRDSYRHCP